jgi:hypothetical protein
MRRIVVKALVVATIGAFVLAAAGCGGGDDESAADTQAAVAATTDSGDAMTVETESEAETTGESEEEPELDFASTENCRELAELGVKVSTALSGAGDSSVEDTKKFLDAFADDAPEEIRDDFRVVAEAYAKIADALADVDVSPGETPSAEDAAKLQQVASEIDQPALEQANTNITTWVNENCKAG